MFKEDSSQGSILIAVIWMLSIFSIFTVVLNRGASQELLLGKRARDQVITRWLAKAGVDRATFELQQDAFLTFDAYNEKWGGKENIFKDIPLSAGTVRVVCPSSAAPLKAAKEGDTNIRYGVCDEAARININFADEATLVNLLKSADSQIDSEEALTAAQSILDWRDKDDAVLPHGAEAPFYKALPEPYLPRNENFESVEELMMVYGITQEIYEAVKDHVTVYTEGKVNFNTATVMTLQALGLSGELAHKVIEFRTGEDQVEGTKDDGIFQAVEAITPALSSNQSFSGEQFKQITDAISKGVVDVKSEVFRIHSIGRLIGNDQSFETGITCVTTRKGQVLYWREGNSRLGAS